ncbi:retrovirus-related pol polyprotein from transposon TNT 1-94 [Tanacetum coccineum]
MATIEVPQTLKYKGGQLNAAPVLEVESFTNWKKRFMYHIIGIEPQFENIFSNGPYILMAAGQRKPETQWTLEERKDAILDQRLKSLIMFVLPDDQMNSVINWLTAKSTRDDLILYHEGPSDVKESRVMDLKLGYNTFKFKEEINIGFINGLPKKWLSFCQSLRNTNHVKDSELASLFGKLKYEENLIDSIYETEKRKSLVSATPLSTVFFSASIIQEFQDNLDDEEDTRSSHEFSSTKETDQTECHKCGKKGHFASDCWSKTSVPSYQSPFQPKLLYSSEHKLEPRQTKYFEAKYNKGNSKLAPLSSSALVPSSSSSKNKGLIAETYDWDEEEVSSDENEVTEVKALMALASEERISVSKESASHDYLCIDLNYVEEQRNNLMSKHRNLVQLNTCKEQLLVLKQAKLDLLTQYHVKH